MQAEIYIMDILEMEKRLNIMCKLAEYNQKIREDYDKGISAVLEGTQKVIDFITKNTQSAPTENELLKDVAVGVISAAIPSEIKILEKGISAMIDIKMPSEPINPIDNLIKIEPEQNTILKEVFIKVSELRNQINESEIELNSKYAFEKTIYELQKMIWETIKSR
jgi:hypothetical protein